MPSRRVLVVDDEEFARRMLLRILEPRGFACETAADAAQARKLVEAVPPDLLLCDIRMPGESGVDLARWVVREYPEVAVVMVSAAQDVEVADDLFSVGVYGYVVKPFTSTSVLMQTSMALRRQELEAENREYVRMLVSLAYERPTLMLDTLREAEHGSSNGGPDEGALHRMAQALEFRERDGSGHTQRVSALSGYLAQLVGMPAARVQEIRQASILHDIGKVAVPDRILLKPGRLDQEERETVQRHPEVGYSLLAGWPGRLFEVGSVIAGTHHEWWDGSGYPHGLSGEEIPVEGRICAIADTFDALTSERPYRDAMSVDDAIEVMVGEAGHFDPALIAAFVGGRQWLPAIRSEFP